MSKTDLERLSEASDDFLAGRISLSSYKLRLASLLLIITDKNIHTWLAEWLRPQVIHVTPVNDNGEEK